MGSNAINFFIKVVYKSNLITTLQFFMQRLLTTQFCAKLRKVILKDNTLITITRLLTEKIISNE